MATPWNNLSKVESFPYIKQVPYFLRGLQHTPTSTLRQKIQWFSLLFFKVAIMLRQRPSSLAGETERATWANFTACPSGFARVSRHFFQLKQVLSLGLTGKPDFFSHRKCKSRTRHFRWISCICTFETCMEKASTNNNQRKTHWPKKIEINHLF